MIRAKNGLGLLLVIIIVLFLAMKLMEFPAAGSEGPNEDEPQWVWDSEGRVHDVSGKYRTMTDEEVCEQLGWGCPEPKKRVVGDLASSSDGGGGR